ncbi:hypothetical protein [Microbacterium sp.]|uniref:hypothetical protein n=1 Tax=Microbacterium sp. TaxID=51671 RepID=UPI002D79983F|nr:hypothetical protein [Microbacterium sp.]HET6300395.1 hypothetical protein [Microbacterium sp.]
MTEPQISPAVDPPPPRRRRWLTPRTLGIASALSAGAAAVALVFATQVAVQATSTPPDATSSTPIAADSTDEDAPEKAAAPIEPPAQIAAVNDKLTASEVEYVRYLGAQHPDFAAGRDMFGGEGMQFLSTDVAEPSAYSDGHRRLISLYYDYATDETVSMVVNVTTRTVESVQRAQGAQPAPTDAETAHAWQLLLESELAEPIAAEFADLTGGSALTTQSAEIELTAHSFSADAGTFGADQCGIQRCVQVLAQVDGGAFLTTSTIVVNLSTQTVLPIS